VTGQVGYQIPTNSFDFTQNAFIPQQLVYGASLHTACPTESEVIDLQLPEFFNHLIPIVEASFTTRLRIILGIPTHDRNDQSWRDLVGSYFQVGLEAVIPSTAKAAAGSAFSASCICILTTCSRRPLVDHCSGEPRLLPQTDLLRQHMRMLTFATSASSRSWQHRAEAHAFSTTRSRASEAPCQPHPESHSFL